MKPTRQNADVPEPLTRVLLIDDDEDDYRFYAMDRGWRPRIRAVG